MDNPRPANVAVVEEVQQRFRDADGAILTEYRGLKVKDLATLRRSLRPSGGDYKIYKNTLVRLAARGSDLGELEPLLVGPTAIAFVDGDAAAVAKALRDYARTNPLLVLKGGVLGGKVLNAEETAALAELPITRGAAGSFRRPAGGPAAATGGSVAGPATELRLRPGRPARPAGRRRVGRGPGPGSRRRPEAERNRHGCTTGHGCNRHGCNRHGCNRHGAAERAGRRHRLGHRLRRRGTRRPDHSRTTNGRCG